MSQCVNQLSHSISSVVGFMGGNFPGFSTFWQNDNMCILIGPKPISLLTDAERSRRKAILKKEENGFAIFIVIEGTKSYLTNNNDTKKQIIKSLTKVCHYE